MGPGDEGVRLEELAELVRRRRRLAMRLSVALDSVPRGGGGRRSLEDSVRLARLAAEYADAMLEVVEWGRERRVLRLRTTS